MFAPPRVFARALVPSLLLPLLVACGPIYRTDYSYIPPESASGRQCLNQCLGMQSMCRATAENRASQSNAACQQSALLKYTTCLATARSDQERGRCSSSSYCNESANYSRCDAEYRMCYQNCGGEVLSRQVCVMGC